MVLHNHPRNVQRLAAGQAPVNSLWFWGAGALPDHVTARVARALTDDDTLGAFLAAGGADVRRLPGHMAASDVAAGGTTLIDLRHARDLAVLNRDWLSPLLATMAAGRLAGLTPRFRRWTPRPRCARGHRWRFWRRPWSAPGVALSTSPDTAT